MLPLAAQGVAGGGVGEEEGNRDGFSLVRIVGFHYLGHQCEAVAAAEETRHVGLHHQGLAGDEGLVEGACLDVLGDCQPFYVPAGEQFGHGEAACGRTGAVGAQVGKEEGQCALVPAHLHLWVFAAVFVAGSAGLCRKPLVGGA